MKAYMKDVQQNPDLTSQSIKDMAEEKNIILPKPQEEKKKTHWHEAKAEEGHTYYWHSVTGGNFYHVLIANFMFYELVDSVQVWCKECTCLFLSNNKTDNSEWIRSVYGISYITVDKIVMNFCVNSDCIRKTIVIALSTWK